MATETLFDPCENLWVDMCALPIVRHRLSGRTKAALSQPRFLDSYLAFRAGPRHRPDPRQPYAPLDVLVLDALRHAEQTGRMKLSSSQLMDVVVLFPPEEDSSFLPDRGGHLVEPLRKLISAVDADEENAADAVDVILGVFLAGCGEPALEAFNMGSSQIGVVNSLRRWRVKAEAAGCCDEDSWYIENSAAQIESMFLARGQSGSTKSFHSQQGNHDTAVPDDDLVEQVRQMLPDASIESINAALQEAGCNAEAAVGFLLDGFEAAGRADPAAEHLIPIGKRTARRKEVGDVTASETFTGEKVDVDGGYSWLQARIDTEIARQEAMDPDDPRDHTGAYTYLVDASTYSMPAGMYDDDPDEAPLEDEEALDEGSRHGKPGSASIIERGSERVTNQGSSFLEEAEAGTSEDADDGGEGFGDEVDSGPESDENNRLANRSEAAEGGRRAERTGRGRGRGHGPGQGSHNPARGRGRGHSAGPSRGTGCRGGGSSRKDSALRKQVRAAV